MEVKIKQGKEMIDAKIEMVDGDMVVSPKEVKFEPKDGDVIVSGGDTRFVAIFKRMKEEYSFYYYSLIILKGDKRPQINNWGSFLKVRSATEEEKKLLFDKLAEEGFAWDAEKKELVKIKWKPREEEDYYAPSFDNVKFETYLYGWVEDEIDCELYNMGWVFKTEQECQEFCDKLNQAINQVKP